MPTQALPLAVALSLVATIILVAYADSRVTEALAASVGIKRFLKLEKGPLYLAFARQFGLRGLLYMRYAKLSCLLMFFVPVLVLANSIVLELAVGLPAILVGVVAVIVTSRTLATPGSGQRQRNRGQME